MKTDIMERWCERLEDDHMVQVHSILTAVGENGEVVGNCCLGVLTEMAVEEGVIDFVDLGWRRYYNDGARQEYQALPVKVQEWAGIGQENPNLDPRKYNWNYSIAELNDSGNWSFKDIAKVIREEHETF